MRISSSIHMSSTHPLPSSSSEPKKKFGKNLNKLTKPPPPTATSISTLSSRVGSSGSALSSRNGLHVLSAKRSNSITSSTNGTGGSLLGTKSKISSSVSFGQSSGAKVAPRPLNTPSLKSESSYETLLSSNVSVNTSSGISGWGNTNTNDSGNVPPPQPAWGLGEKSSQQSTVTNANKHVSTLAPKGRVSVGYHTPNNPTSLVNSIHSTTTTSTQQRADHGETSNNYLTRNIRSESSGKIIGGRKAEDSFDSDEYLTGTRVSDSLQFDPRSQNWSDSSKSHYSNTFPKTLNKERKDIEIRDQDIQQESKQQSDPSYKRNIIDDNQNKQNLELQQTKSLNESSVDIKTNQVSSPLRNTFTNEESESIKDNLEVDDQVEYMKRRARERAEERRAEEEARMNEQKERAARRLKELEEKMSQSQIHAETTDGYKKKVKREDRFLDQDKEINDWKSNHSKITRNGSSFGNPQYSSEIILERLGRNDENKSSAGRRETNSKNGASITSSKKLFDPNRTFSSLLGGGNAHKTHFANNSIQQERPPSPPPVLQISVKTSNIDQTYSYQGNRENGNINVSSSGPMIQLASYEDRDRGQTGPRMLFDPKSGSMIHAPSLDKRNAHHYKDDNGQGGKGKKERNKQKSRSRDRDSKSESGSGSTSKKLDSHYSSSNDDQNSRRKQSGDLDENSDGKSGRRNRKKDENRKRNEKDTWYFSNNTEQPDSTLNNGRIPIGSDGGNGQAQHLKRFGIRNSQTRNLLSSDTVKIPRTCGVLYKVDEAGKYICADGCEADQGYGAHSVPGGRIRNPTAHAQFLGQQQRLHLSLKESASSKFDEFHQNPYDRQNQHISYTNVTPKSNYTNSFSSPRQQQALYHYNTINPDVYKQHQFDVINQSSGSLSYKNNQKKFDGSNVVSGKKSIDNEPESNNETFELPAELRVKANEPLSILSGVPDSPELQATAHPWAPSEAALAAAAANSSAQIGSVQSQKSDDSESSLNVTAEMMRIINEPDDDVGNNEDGSCDVSYIIQRHHS